VEKLMSAHPRLLSPLTVGPVELRNRVVSTAHGAFLDFYRPGEPGDRYIAYQERRAAGGAGLIVLQPVHVHASSQALGHHVYDPDDLRPKLRDMAGALHHHGSAAVIQLMHFGAEFTSDARTDLQPLWAFSERVSPTGGEVAHEMTASEIEAVIDGFARTAVLAVDAGLDGVELHAAHGYLVHQSFSPWANWRTDDWGDPMRFVTVTLQRMRDAIGPDAILGIRMSLDDYVPAAAGGLGPEGLRRVAAEVVATGLVDYLSTSSGSRAAHYATAVGGYEHPTGMFLDLVASMRTAIGAAVPVIGMGRITSPDLAEHALTTGACDLVAMTRAQIADPDIVRKIEAQEVDRIRPCVGANQGCVDRMYQALPITCFHNPDVGREHRLGPLASAEVPRRVVVVGGGPAGMKAAAVAAARGHDVVLLESEEHLGGRLRWAASYGPQRELQGSIDWLAEELRRVPVEIRLGDRADVPAVLSLAPDAVVLACGSRAPAPLLPGLDASVPVVTPDEVMAMEAATGAVLVVDHLGTVEALQPAERLAAFGSDVTIVTPMPQLGPKLGFTHVRAQLRRLHAAGCVVQTSTRFVGLADGVATIRHVHSGASMDVPVDAVVAAVPRHANMDLRDGLVAAGVDVHLVGDAVAPRTAMHAFRDGDDVGRML
jgi:2,4-dienoyl-CoA reductase-like NADH-dependent reductase (Old Yellow Enzyme family)/thioredoxin reductase